MDPTPDQIANVTEAITAALWLGVALAIYAYLSHRTEDNGPTRWQRWRDWLTTHYLTSSSDSAPPHDAGMELVSIPVSQTSMDDHTSAPTGAGMSIAAPDIDALDAGMDDWSMPRLSARLSDAEMIVLLATQRRADGKHRYSANQIQTLIGGDRNTVLARIKELRGLAPPAVYRPLTPDH